MPHCWPQKQQCVRTRRSGSTVVESRSPRIRARCGPNRSIMFSSSTGRVAIVAQPVVQRAPPERTLCEPEQRAPAPRTDLLIVVRAFLRLHLIAESELPLDLGEVA